MSISLSAFLLLILGLIFLIFFIWRHYFSLAKKALLDWARQENFKVIELKRCQWDLGPFKWKAVRGQEVFRIQVQDFSGQIRRAWIRVNVPIYGSLLNLVGGSPVEVHWE